MQFEDTLSEIISTNRITWKQNLLLRHPTSIALHWVNIQSPDANGWIYLYKGKYNAYTTTLEYLKLSEQCGNIYAKNDIGDYYYRKNEFTEAVKYYRNAYELGDHIFAPREIGFMYRKGLGVDKNIKEAIKWFKIAADNGNGSAANSIYEMSDDLLESVEYGMKAIECGYEMSEFNRQEEMVYRDYIDCKYRLKGLLRLQSLDIGSLVYYDVKRYM
jgi:tetratricopeptide (TPR) repeat protein